MDIKKGLGKKIQYFRKKRGLTQEQLAEAIELETVTVSKIETGRSYPTSENLAKIASVLSVEPRELYNFPFGKTKNDIMTDIFNKIQKLSSDNKKLDLIYNIINAIE